MRLVVVFCLVGALARFLTPPQPLNNEVPPPAGASCVIEHALDGEAPPVIRWFNGDCLDYGGLNDECVGGMTWVSWGLGHRPEIHILAEDFEEGVSDHVVHEILHLKLYYEKRWPDPGHMDSKWNEVGDIADSINDSCFGSNT